MAPPFIRLLTHMGTNTIILIIVRDFTVLRTTLKNKMNCWKEIFNLMWEEKHYNNGRVGLVLDKAFYIWKIHCNSPRKNCEMHSTTSRSTREIGGFFFVSFFADGSSPPTWRARIVWLVYTMSVMVNPMSD